MGNARDKPGRGRVQRAMKGLEEMEIEAPLLGNFLPVHHLFTSLGGKLAFEEVQGFILQEMYGKVKMVKTDLWVGPVPEEGLEKEEDSEEKIADSSADSQKEKDEVVIEKNEVIGFYWEDLEFIVDMKTGGKKQDDGQDDEKSSGIDGLPIPNNTRVQGRVVVRRHPTMKSQTGTPLNVIYLKRTGSVMPHYWQQITTTILQGVAHIMEGIKTKYFESHKNSAGLASSAVSSLLCCSSGAAKKLVE